MKRILFGVRAALLMASLTPAASAEEPATGPSFACESARTPLEMLICGSSRLSAQDAAMAALFRRHLDQAATPDERQARLREQRAWNAERTESCDLSTPATSSWQSPETCVSNLYARRIGELHSHLFPEDAAALDRALALLPTNPQGADALLAGSDGAVARLDRLLYLHAFHAPSAARDRTIRDLQADLDRIADLAMDGYTRDVLGPRTPYDGSAESLVRTVQAAGASALGWGSPLPYLIPCPVLQRAPALLAATRPLFGSNRDNFLPRSGCAWGRGQVEGFPDASISAFVEAARAADGQFLATHQGSIVHAHAARQAAALEQLKLNPHALPPGPEPTYAPYAVWSYLSVDNHRVASVIRNVYEKARTELATYYLKAGMAEDKAEARRLSALGLFDAVWGAECGEAPPPTALRTLILDGGPTAELSAFITGGKWRDGDVLEPFRICAREAGRDPLIHIAVTRPDLLDDLAALAQPLPEPQREELDLEFDPSARNGFGKVPLMSAAQWDSLGGVDWLLARGADVNAATDLADEWQAGPKHGRRTALMYAAANASLPLIRRLIGAGADVQATDSKGLRALDYLTGKGPVPPNPLLSKAERAEAERLLR